MRDFLVVKGDNVMNIYISLDWKIFSPNYYQGSAPKLPSIIAQTGTLQAPMHATECLDLFLPCF
jgi:hypothetical protein